MSVRVMSQVWEVDLPDSEKIVLLALADCANDEGHCWPSMATLAKKCSKSDRTCQAAIKALVKSGHVTRNEVAGKGCNYTVHPVRARPQMEGYIPPESHYVYRIEDPATGEFYIGARSCVGKVDDDDYMGSGNWVKECRRTGVALRKVVLDVVASREALGHAELCHVRPVFGNGKCRNAKLPTPGTLSETGYRGETPEATSPRSDFAPKGTTPTPEAASDKPSRTIIPSEAKASSGKRAKPKDGFELPVWVPRQEWDSYVVMRRTIRKPMTPRAMTLAVRELERLKDAGFPPGDVLDQSVMNSWQGLFRIKDENNGQQTRGVQRHEPPRINTLGAAILAREAARRS